MHLVTGSAGYVGDILANALLRDKHSVIGVDLAPTHAETNAHLLHNEQVDLTDYEAVEKIFMRYQGIQCVYHCAAQIIFKNKHRDYFYKSNVDATAKLVELAIQYGIKHFVYISTNCVYGRISRLGVKEDAPLGAFDEYGKSKQLSEEALKPYRDKINLVILRPPPIIGEGRLGVLSVVFDFVKENRKLWLVGSGENKFQLVYGPDVVSACRKAATFKGSAVFNIGSKDPHSFKQIFTNLVKSARSQTKIYHIPAFVIIPVMRLCYRLGISPLVPYQFNMITNTYSGDISLIKKKLGWQPSKNNSEIIIAAYDYYIKNYDAIHSSENLAGHRKAGKAGVIALLKWLS